MVRWLANITPLNAPVLPVYVCDLPLTGVKSGAELAARMSAAGLHPIVQATLMRPPVERGLPRYANGRPVVIPDAAIREDGRKTDKLTGRLYWAIEAAIWRDLEGRSFIDIAKGLGHSDYLQFERGNSAYRPRPQRAERLIVDGRDLLHLLGAWP